MAVLATLHESSKQITSPLKLRRKDWLAYLFVSPMVLSLCMFTLYPLLESFRLSFYNTNGVTGSFVGWYNYRYVLSDPIFRDAFYNTGYIGLLSIFIGLPVSLVFATLVNSLPVCQNQFKSIYFAPNVTSAVASAIVFMYLFYPTDHGWVNILLGWFGIGPFRWFADPSLSKLGIVIMGVWHSLGYTMLIWLAGLQAIPRVLYEAAEIDGAGRFRRWLNITLPGLRPIIFFVVVIQTIGAFKRFTDVYQIGGSDGQPGGSLTTLMVYIYRLGFNTFEFGKASAASFITFLVIILFTLINFRLFRERDT